MDNTIQKRKKFYELFHFQKIRYELIEIIACVIQLGFLPVTVYACTIFDIDIVKCFALLTIISLELYNVCSSIVWFVMKKDKFDQSYDDFYEIIKPENKRKEISHDKFESLTISDLTYRYHIKTQDQVDKETEICIPKFSVKAGEKVCITGESGQGKTTLLNLISNEIENDHVSLNSKGTNKRLDCVFVSQDTEILDMSLKDNLTFGRKTDDNDIIDSLRKVGLGNGLIIFTMA